MKRATSALHWLAPLAIILAGGCAPAYHSYSGCYVDCTYCEPPPLPYMHYEGCICQSCASSQYMSVQPPSMEEDS